MSNIGSILACSFNDYPCCVVNQNHFHLHIRCHCARLYHRSGGHDQRATTASRCHVRVIEFRLQ